MNPDIITSSFISIGIIATAIFGLFMVGCLFGILFETISRIQKRVYNDQKK